MLKRGFLVLMLATGLAACDDDDTPTSPADPNLAVFTAQLSAQNEVPPPITNSESTARGDVRIEFRLNRDSGNNVTGATVDVHREPERLPRRQHVDTGAHSRGLSGVAGGVRVDTGLTRTAIPLVNGGITGHRFENITVTTIRLTNES